MTLKINFGIHGIIPLIVFLSRGDTIWYGRNGYSFLSLTYIQVGEILFTSSQEGSLKTLSDEELVSLIKKGKEEAFSELYERYFDKIYRFVARRIGGRETTEDVVSQIFFKAFHKRRSFIWRTSFQAWLYRIAQNTITDYYRTLKPSENLPDDNTSHSLFTNTKNEIDHELLRKTLEHILEKLNDRERLVVTLKFYNEYEYEEIAALLKTNVNHVRVLLHRALKKCKAWLPEHYLYDI